MSVSAEAKVRAAVVVAAGLFERAKALGNSPLAWKFAKLAADAIDRTQPHPVLQMAYRDKPKDQPDAEFLANNLSFLEALAPAEWPQRKVRPNEWGEFTRVVRGLDEFFGAEPANPKEVARNRAALSTFTTQYGGVLAAEDQAILAAALKAEEVHEL